MSTDSFLFIAACLIILPFHELGNEQISAVAAVACFTLIMTIGISHGAIDNILYRLNHKVDNRVFIFIYLLIIVLNVALWFMLPNLATASFLIISAYHFGQSQLSDLKNAIDPLRRSLFFLWGCSLIMALIHFNRAEIMSYPTEVSLLNMPFFNYLVENSQTLWLSSTLLWFIPFSIHEIFVNRRINYLLLQTYFMFIIHIAFVLFSTLVGFTLYFVILHSLKVLMQEYGEINLKTINFSLRKFVMMLLPFTMISILGTVLIYALHFSLNWNLSLSLLGAIIISSITLPHSYVMELFYQSRGTKDPF